MQKPNNSRFLYHAHAIGVSASLTKPQPEEIEAQAACALSIHGGKASGSSYNFKHRILSFDSAESRIQGAQEVAGDHSHLITVTVQGLNVMNIVKADTVVLRMVSHHVIGSPAAHVTVGSHIDNLKIAGQSVGLTLDGQILTDWDTYDKAKAGLDARGVNPGSDGTYSTSIFSSVGSVPGATVTGNQIYIPQFGSIYLGEIFIRGAQRHVTMMRFEFGCPDDGSGTIGDGQGNGQTFP